MAGSMTLNVILDVPVTSTAQALFVNTEDNILDEDSVVVVFANREAIGVELQVKMGTEEVVPSAAVAINAVVGDVPGKAPATLAWVGMGKQGQAIVLNAANSTAGLLECRATVFIISLEDLVVLPGILNILGG